MNKLFKIPFLLLICSSVAHSSTQIGITVDDIPAAGNSPKGLTRLEVAQKYLKLSRDLKLPKQFGFFNGIYSEGMQERQDIMKLWAKEHYVGNHTYSHDGLNLLGPEKFKKDIEKNESFLIDISSSIAELKYIRFPYLQEGGSNEVRYDIRFYLRNRNYKIAQVSIDPSDWKWNEAYLHCLANNNPVKSKKFLDLYTDHIVKTAKGKLKQVQMIWGTNKKVKHVLLLHLNPLLADSIESMDKKLKAAGFEFIDAKEAIDDPFYNEDSTYIGSVGKDYIEQNIVTRKLTQKPEAMMPSVPDGLRAICL